MKKFLKNLWQLIIGKSETKETPKEEVKIPKPERSKGERKTEKWKLKKCIVMDKFMFTREQAQQKKNEHLGKAKGKYLRIYSCQFCGAWHLTHKK